jgi:hypothetical protein
MLMRELWMQVDVDPAMTPRLPEMLWVLAR